MRIKAFAMTAMGLCALAVPASAQIIATSIPRAEAAGTGKGVEAGEKKWALHLMASPLSKWRYNELATGICVDPNSCQTPLLDSGVFTGTPNSDFLLAAEGVFKLGSDWSIGVGGWYNKVGRVQYDFDVVTIGLQSGIVSRNTGTLDGDLKMSEGHASLYYRNFGIQGGIVHTNSKLTTSKIKTSVQVSNCPTGGCPIPANVGLALNSIEGESTSNDWDVYGVYKYGGGSRRSWGVSVGAGIYRKKGSTEASQRAAEDQTVFSGFATASVDVFKGLGVDASYWYVGKTEATRGENALVTSDAASRFTIGVGYSFSK